MRDKMHPAQADKEAKFANRLLTMLESEFTTPNAALCFLAAFCRTVIHRWSAKTGQESRTIRAFTNAVQGVEEKNIIM